MRLLNSVLRFLLCNFDKFRANERACLLDRPAVRVWEVLWAMTAQWWGSSGSCNGVCTREVGGTPPHDPVH